MAWGKQGPGVGAAAGPGVMGSLGQGLMGEEKEEGPRTVQVGALVQQAQLGASSRERANRQRRKRRRKRMALP